MAPKEAATTLTARQQSVLDFIGEYQQHHHIAPSVREMAAHLGFKSPAGIHRILNILKQKSYLTAERGKKRCWRLTNEVTAKGIPLIKSNTVDITAKPFEDFEELLPIDPVMFGSEGCFGLRVSGDAMKDADIAEGDIAIIQPRHQVENGDIAAVTIEDQSSEISLKIVERTSTALTLKAANSNYRNMVFWRTSADRVSIIGKYVGLIRRV